MKDGTTKRYLYREICSLLNDKLYLVFGQLSDSRKESEEAAKSFDMQFKLQKQKSELMEEQHNKLLQGTKEAYTKEIGELTEKYERLKNENLLLSDSVRQLKRDLVQQQSDMNFYQIQSTNEFEKRIRELLEKFQSLEENSTKNDQHYVNQYECMNDLVSNHQSAIVKLRLSKETIAKQATQIEQLLSEVSRLNVRASTQFHDLTPRSSFTELEDICNEIKDPNFKANEQVDKQKNNIPIIKFSDLDSASRIKKISSVIKKGFGELKESMLQLLQRSDSLSMQNKLKSKSPLKQSIRIRQAPEDLKSVKKKSSQFNTRKNSTEIKDIKQKKTQKKSKFEQGLQNIQRESLQANELNISDNLSLNSEDKFALQKQSVDEYEDSFNDL